MKDGLSHEATVQQWLQHRYSEMTADLGSLLDLESGLRDATLPGQHLDIVVDLDAALDVEAGLADVVATAGVGTTDRSEPHSPKTQRPIRRLQATLLHASASPHGQASVTPPVPLAPKSSRLSVAVAAVAWTTIAVLTVAMAGFAIRGLIQGLTMPSAGSPHNPANATCVYDACGKPAPTGAVTLLRIPSIGIEVPLDLLTVDANGRLTPPRSYDRPGWVSDGVIPGDVGPAVIVGHTDSERGPAVFFLLHTLRSGDAVEVKRGEQWMTFRVTSIEQYPKGRFPADRVYMPTPAPELRLVADGGKFNLAPLSMRTM